ncbi:tRNA 2-thiocytidine biosynthesis protein TtcA [bacterium HR23]|nr:tRNA 2-thiocytidine biosynthesis protein TtcA [bacterium HR23]
MKCQKCGQKASVDLRRHNTAFCAVHYLEFFERQVQRTIERWRMFTPQDRILVAVSGGKDSLTLWEVLLRLGYRPTGLHIHLGIGAYSDLSQAKTEAFARSRGLSLLVVNLEEAYGLGVPQLAKALRRVPCSGCGLSKRYITNRVALENGFTVVATGHNLDDEAATLLGNLLHWQTDALARQSPVLEADHPRLVKRVKPLFLMTEKETVSYALLRRIDYIPDECPYAQGARSLLYKDALNQIELHSPGSKQQLVAGFLERLRPLLAQADRQTVGECQRCGQPTTGVVCAFCRMWDQALKRIPVTVRPSDTLSPQAVGPSQAL